ncbi:MAG TPA: hypothetical protein VH518_06685 [Tepidisphaeraceae bacterium]|jgi:hypothetical protein
MSDFRPFLIDVLEPRRHLAAAWSNVIDNPLMPLIPGATWVYKGVVDGEPEINRIVVLGTTKKVMGVTTTVVLDRVYVNGKLAERTHDFFAQDRFGNVWYFGENSEDIENGKVVSTEGTWRAGVNGATPGLVMEAHPLIGDAYQQEHAPGVAEDQAKVSALNVRVASPFGTFSGCLETSESSPLEPTVSERKFYTPGIGLVKSQSSGSENEVIKLISFVP